MFEREVVFGELLEAEDVCILGCVFDPRSFFNEVGADLFKFDPSVRNHRCLATVWGSHTAAYSSSNQGGQVNISHFNLIFRD